MVTITAQMRRKIQTMVDAEKAAAGEYDQVLGYVKRKNMSDEAAFTSAYDRWNTRIS